MELINQEYIKEIELSQCNVIESILKEYNLDLDFVYKIEYNILDDTYTSAISLYKNYENYYKDKGYSYNIVIKLSLDDKDDNLYKYNVNAIYKGDTESNKDKFNELERVYNIIKNELDYSMLLDFKTIQRINDCILEFREQDLLECKYKEV